MKRRSKTSTTNSSEGHLRIDEFLADYDFSATYQIRINASPSVVYERLFWLDFNDLWLVRLLESVRTRRLLVRSRVSTDFRQRLEGTGFVMLAEVPNQELVTGIAGDFGVLTAGAAWISQQTILFVSFDRAMQRWPGTSVCEQLHLMETVLSTETRIEVFWINRKMEISNLLGSHLSFRRSNP